MRVCVCVLFEIINTKWRFTYTFIHTYMIMHINWSLSMFYAGHFTRSCNRQFAYRTSFKLWYFFPYLRNWGGGKKKGKIKKIKNLVFVQAHVLCKHLHISTLRHSVQRSAHCVRFVMRVTSRVSTRGTHNYVILVRLKRRILSLDMLVMRDEFWHLRMTDLCNH